jgi:hypothetical protein
MTARSLRNGTLAAAKVRVPVARTLVASAAFACVNLKRLARRWRVITVHRAFADLRAITAANRSRAQVVVTATVTTQRQR